MDKFDVINQLKENGLFDLTKSIVDTLSGDTLESHKKANAHAAALAKRIYDMHDWTLLSVKTMIDLATRLYGFVQGLSYSDIDAINDDAYDSIEELYELVWNNCFPIISK